MAWEQSQRVAAIAPSATEEVDNEVKRLRREGAEDLLSLAVGEPCFDTPRFIKRAACDALMAGKTKYEPTAGDFALREAVSAKLSMENGIQVPLEDIVITAGAKFAIFLAFQAILSPGDAVILFDPAWVSYGPAAELAGAGVRWVPTLEEEGFQPDLDAYRAALDDRVKIVVVNSPNNPTGAVYPASTTREIVQRARDNGTYVLSDEIYEHLIYQSTHYSPASEFDNVITINGFSKAFAMTGWRLGFGVAPSAVVEGMLKVYQHSTSCVTAFAQAGALEALVSAKSRPALEEMRDAYRKRREVMVRGITRSEHFELSGAPHGAFYTFPRYRSDCASIEVSKHLLKSAHVATVPGEAFGPSGQGHLRLSYATDVSSVESALERMEDYFVRQSERGG